MRFSSLLAKDLLRQMPEPGSRSIPTFARVDYPKKQPQPKVTLLSWRGQRPVEEEISY